jgi:hypothetical protein
MVLPLKIARDGCYIPAMGLIDRSAGTPEEEARIRELVRQAAEPEGFRDFDLMLGEDSTDDPAVYISFYVGPEYSADESKVGELHRLRRRVTTALFQARIDRQPYLKFRERETAKG